jgi:hypothetical protein
MLLGPYLSFVYWNLDQGQWYPWGQWYPCNISIHHLYRVQSISIIYYHTNSSLRDALWVWYLYHQLLIDSILIIVPVALQTEGSKINLLSFLVHFKLHFKLFIVKADIHLWTFSLKLLQNQYLWKMGALLESQ